MLMSFARLVLEVFRQAAQYARLWFLRSVSKTCLRNGRDHRGQRGLRAFHHEAGHPWEKRACVSHRSSKLVEADSGVREMVVEGHHGKSMAAVVADSLALAVNLHGGDMAIESIPDDHKVAAQAGHNHRLGGTHHHGNTLGIRCSSLSVLGVGLFLCW